MLLSSLTPGENGVVLEILAEGALGQRLMDLGFFPGTRVTAVRNAPLFDPIDIAVADCHVSLRHDEAAYIKVEKS